MNNNVQALVIFLNKCDESEIDIYKEYFQRTFGEDFLVGKTTNYNIPNKYRLLKQCNKTISSNKSLKLISTQISF